MVVVSGLGSLPEPHMGQDAHPWPYIQLGLPSWVLNQVRNCHPGFYIGQRIVILVLISGKTYHPGPYIGHSMHVLLSIWGVGLSPRALSSIGLPLLALYRARIFILGIISH